MRSTVEVLEAKLLPAARHQLLQLASFDDLATFLEVLVNRPRVHAAGWEVDG